MAENAVATEKAQTPEKQQRVRSKIDFPYTALDLAIALAKAVHALGSECDWAQLGARLDMAADGGGFRQRLQAARMFGLITYNSSTVTLTQLGAQINDPDQLAGAKVQAFLNVALYKAIYDEYRTTTLPGAEGFEKPDGRPWGCRRSKGKGTAGGFLQLLGHRRGVLRIWAESAGTAHGADTQAWCCCNSTR